jgi:drug/metabolite transporter (DMT)-like permease
VPSSSPGGSSALTRFDLLLFLMVSIWGANFSLVKVALREFPELVFNALRLMLASSLFLGAIWWQQRTTPRPALTRAEWRRIMLLGLIGHLVYQFLFLGGLKRTSVANGSLIMGTTPVIVALLSAWTGHERISLQRWIGAAISFTGLYIVVGAQAGLGNPIGDLLVLASTVCWATYSVASVPLLKRHSPLVVTGYTMTVGATAYTVAAVPALQAMAWTQISATGWVLLVASAVFALGLAYLIWYSSVQRVGSTRTAAWSNLTPVMAMSIAALWIGEGLTLRQVAGAAVIFAGLVTTRRG